MPWELAYGEAGVGDLIPPKTDLEFTVELLAVNKKGVAEDEGGEDEGEGKEGGGGGAGDGEGGVVLNATTAANTGGGMREKVYFRPALFYQVIGL